MPAAIAPPKQVAVAVTSDKGLCGGLNSTITKYSKVLMAMTPSGEYTKTWSSRLMRVAGGPAQLFMWQVV